MSYSVRFFGTSAAIPSISRGFSCIGLVDSRSSGEDIILLDCGDGSIRKIMETFTNCLSISNVLVTHMHSDHLSGLTQLIETMGIEKRTKDLNVYGPKGLNEYFDIVQKSTFLASNRNFKILIHEVDAKQILTLGKIHVTPSEMQHTVPCLGYRIEGPEFVLAYTGDTEPCNELIPLAKDADLLVHEATFLGKDAKKARESKHSTPTEAAKAANKAGARNLVLTHVSDRDETEKEMLEEANPVYSKTKVAYDGLELNL